jgi:endonuclease YncB( thermonuclease family)
MARRGRRSRASPEKMATGPSLIESVALAAACLSFLAVMFFVFDRGARTRPVTGMTTNERRDSNYESGKRYACDNVTVVDGDTLRCGRQRVRLASIDAPEMPGHCRSGRVCTPGDPFASTSHLRRLISSRPVECVEIDVDNYGRSVSFCSAGGEDLSCGQVRAGVAVVRYGSLNCE